eukprot:m.61271 g.61271  ORF g.61271 m.61271 type:complete len:595 (+) comp11392_c0_seq1:355-2139(+)
MIIWVFLLLVTSSSTQGENGKPHIFMMLVDDWGSYDASWIMKSYNRTPDIHTPNIDHLSSLGLRFTNYYVQPICSPTRSVLLSGRYSIHTGAEHILFGAEEPSCLPTTLPLMPHAFKKLGYQTHMVGKWHLGYYNDTCSPWRRGFDTYIGYLNGEEGYYTHGMGPYKDFHECVNNSDSGPFSSTTSSNCDNCTHKYEGQYSTTVYTEHIQKIITLHKSQDPPIFAYVAWQSVHEPMQAPMRYLKPYSATLDPSRRIYAGMLAALDEGLGNITASLKANGLYENSVLVVSNDNGGMSGTYGLGCCNCGTSCGGLNYPYRGYKDSFWEGGFRGNGFVHSPLLPSGAGETVYTPLLHVSDWFRTLLYAAISNENPETQNVTLHGLEPLLQAGPIDSVNHWENMMAVSTRRIEPRSEILLAGFDIDKQGAAIRVGSYKLLVGNWGDDRWCDLNVSGLSPIAPAPPSNNPGTGPGGYGGLVCVHLNSSNATYIPASVESKSGKANMYEIVFSLKQDYLAPKPPWTSVIKGLYNVVDDPRELYDLQHALPDMVSRLYERLLYFNKTTVPSIHKPRDPNADTHANETGGCWSPWANSSLSN